MTQAEREKAIREHEQMLRNHNDILRYIVTSLDELIGTLRYVRVTMVGACPDFGAIETEMRRADLLVTSICNELHEIGDTDDELVATYPYIEPDIDEALRPFTPYVRNEYITDDGSDLKTLPKPRKKREAD